MYRLRYVAVALVAGTVGAAVALLLAPDSGRNTRRKMMRRLEREREALVRQSRRLAEQAGDYLEEAVRDGKKAVARAADEVADGVQERFEKGQKSGSKRVR